MPAIRDHLGLDTNSQVTELIRAHLAQWDTEDNQVALRLELERLDQMLLACMRIIAKPPPKVTYNGGEYGEGVVELLPADEDVRLRAMDKMIKIQQRRSEYLGLDVSHRRDDDEHNQVDAWLAGQLGLDDDPDETVGEVEDEDTKVGVEPVHRRPVAADVKRRGPKYKRRKPGA